MKKVILLTIISLFKPLALFAQNTELSIDSAKASTEYIFYNPPLYSPEMSPICKIKRSFDFELISNTNTFRLKYSVESVDNQNIVCEHGLPKKGVVEGIYAVVRKDERPPYNYFDVELLSQREAVNNGALKPLLLPRTLGALRLSPDSTTLGEQKGFGTFNLFGSLFPKGVEVSYFSPNSVELREESLEFQSVILK